jgi:hypothetical protein
MKKYPLIGISVLAVILLVLGSLTNVVGYHAIQSSNQKVIKDEVDQKELLFQTILDIANNKEVQKIILNSELKRGGIFLLGIRFSVITPNVLTKKELNSAYNIGMILTKTLSKSRIHSLLERFQVNNQGVQNDITTVIEKDTKLKGEITQLSNLKCDCGNENTIWNFPVLCLLLTPIIMFLLIIQAVAMLIFHVHNLPFIFFLTKIIGNIGLTLNCAWATIP